MFNTIRRLNLQRKFTLFLSGLFICSVLLSGAVLSITLHRKAEKEAFKTAEILIETMNSVRSYTSDQVQPQLMQYLQMQTEFIKETVPAYSARAVFERLRQQEQYSRFSYREATLNPTNTRDQADRFEFQLIQKFRQAPDLPVQSGYRTLGKEKFFYIAYPLRIQKASCLTCHGDPRDAPQSLINTYGDQHGFGWKLNEIIATQMVYVPTATVFSKVQNYWASVMLQFTSIFAIFLAVLVFVMNRTIARMIINPIQHLIRLSQKLTDSAVVPASATVLYTFQPADKLLSFPETSRHFLRHCRREKRSQDELVILARTFYTMHDRIQILIEHLERQADGLRQSQALSAHKADELEVALTDLQQAQAQLIRSEKIASLGQLVAGVAHEINNPINFIYGNLSHAKVYAEDLLRLITRYQTVYPDPTPELQQNIDAIDLDYIAEDFPKLMASMKVGAERVREIVASLRTFSRLDEAVRSTVDIHAGIEDSLVILNSRLKGDGDRPPIAVIKHYGECPDLDCFPGKLNQVFMNLLINAIDALEEHWYAVTADTSSVGPDLAIQITTKTIGAENSIPIAPGSSVGNQSRIHITIADNGPGISPEVQQRLFDPFYTTKPIGKGTGLGLSISYKIIVDYHQGSIDCLSDVGQGTQFCIELPLINPQVSNPQVSNPQVSIKE